MYHHAKIYLKYVLVRTIDVYKAVRIGTYQYVVRTYIVQVHRIPDRLVRQKPLKSCCENGKEHLITKKLRISQFLGDQTQQPESWERARS